MYLETASRVYVKRIDFAHEQAYEIFSRVAGEKNPEVEQYERKKRKRKKMDDSDEEDDYGDDLEVDGDFDVDSEDSDDSDDDSDDSDDL